MRCPSLAALAVLLLGLAGCGPEGPPRFNLTGHVTLAGQPVPAGMNFFDPDYAQGNDGQQGFAFIKDGQFDTRLQGQPTVGGKHIVRIHAFDGKQAGELPMGTMLIPEFSTPADLPKEDASRNFEIPRSVQPAPPSAGA